MIEILPNLWIGNKKDSFNEEFIKMIDIIIKCSKDEPFMKSNTQKMRIKVEITEDPQIYKQNNELFLKYMIKIVPFIHKNLLKRKRILVCCPSGKQQCINIILCYLIKYGKINPYKAFDIIKSNVKDALTPVNYFEYTLKEYIKSST